MTHDTSPSAPGRVGRARRARRPAVTALTAASGRRALLLLVWAASVPLSSCTTPSDSEPTLHGGQTGDEGGSYHARTRANGDSPCYFEETVFDEATTTRYGLPLNDVLAALDPPMHQQLFLREYYEPAFRVEPSSGQRPLSVSLARRAGTVYELRDEPWSASEAHWCTETLYEVPVVLSLHADDGTLAETADSVLLVQSPNRAVLTHRFVLVEGESERLVGRPPRPTSRLSGSLTLRSDALVFDSAEMGLRIETFPGGSRGKLWPELYGVTTPEGAVPSEASPLGDFDHPFRSEPVTPDAGDPDELVAPFEARRSDVVGLWPTALDCGGGNSPLPLDARVVGRSVRDVLDEFVRQPLPLATSTGPGAASASRELRLSFEWPDGPLCQLLGATVVRVEMRLLLTSSAGFHARIPVAVDVRTNEAGQLESLSLRDAMSEVPLSREQLERLVDVDWDVARDFEHRYLILHGQSEWDGQRWSGAGSLRVTGHTPGDECVDVEAPDAGASCHPSEFQRSPNQSIAPGKPLLELRWGAP